MSALKKSSPRGLGKGLSALMSDSYSQAPNAAPIEMQSIEQTQNTIALNKIRSGKYQPREFFAETALHELAESIRKNGVMQPILVRAVEDGNYEIIAGERRWRAAKIAGLDEIPVIINNINDEKALELAIIENIQREDLHPLEEGAGYQKLMDEFGYTQENVASTVHKSRSHIANLLRLLVLPNEIQELFSKNLITMGHARALIGVEGAVNIAHDIITRGLNVRQTEKLVSEHKNPNAAIKTPKPQNNKQQQNTVLVYQQPVEQNTVKDPDIMALEDTLSENLGLKVSINDRGQSGEILISYESLEQLDDILRRLGGSA
ncbi:MAG: ParB/RepB/Spo0J family partition protein [Pseudomonadota bacterium]